MPSPGTIGAGVTREELVSLSESRRLALLDLAPVAVVDTSRQSPEATVEEILRQARPFLDGIAGDQRG